MQINKNTFITPAGTLAFPNLLVARAFEEGQDEKFSAILIFPTKEAADKKLLLPLVKFAQEVCDSAHGTGTFEKRDLLTTRILKRGETKDYAGFGEGKSYISCNSKFKPTLGRYDSKEGISVAIDKDDEAAVREMFYAGAICRIQVRCYAYGGNIDKTGRAPGVSLGLNAVEFIQHGPRLSDGPTDEDNIAALTAAGAPVVPTGLPAPEAAPAIEGPKDSPAAGDDEDIYKF